jgi:CDP-diacylglycerol--glycerol-3-phosphate 3-phosphatidyltransferase
MVKEGDFMATITPSRPPVFNIPNQLTTARLGLALVLFFLISTQYWLASTLVFAVAAFTDWLDGYLARRQGLTSTLGRNLDPLVDKVLICGAYIFLLPYGWEDGWLLPWMVTVVVARELVITSLRSFLENQGATFGADWLGKLKMGLQCAALFGVFVFLYVGGLEQEGSVNSPSVTRFFAVVRDGLIWAMLAATALSGLQYLWRATSLLKTGPE